MAVHKAAFVFFIVLSHTALSARIKYDRIGRKREQGWTCKDTNNGATDMMGNSCGSSTYCSGTADDGDFFASIMCCKCGGGGQEFDFKWVHGQISQSCTRACKEEGLHCVESEWPNTANNFLTILGTRTSCTKVSGSAYQADADPLDELYEGETTCFWMPNGETIKIKDDKSRCGTVPNNNYRRFCPCAAEAPSERPVPPKPGFPDCDFEQAEQCGWTSENHRYKWTRTSGATPTAGTGPSQNSAGSFAHKGSYYMFAKSIFRNNKEFVLESPDFELPTESMVFQFWYNMIGQNIGTLRVEFQLPSGWVKKWSKYGPQEGNDWVQAIVGIPVGATKVKFVGKVGHGWRSDFAIDDVEFVKGTAPVPVAAPTISYSITAFGGQQCPPNAAGIKTVNKCKETAVRLHLTYVGDLGAWSSNFPKGCLQYGTTRAAWNPGSGTTNENIAVICTSS